jgi:hypothetical protein
MKILCSTLLTFIALAGYAQTKITGKVVDERGAGIPLANVILVDTYDGTSSDTEGNFEFTTTETGTKILLVKFVGYKDSQREVVLQGKSVTVTVQLEEMINELEAVMITAGAFAASDESRRTVFKAIDIATTAGATADIAGALNTLPGTQKVGESGRLFVRGGDGTEAKTFIVACLCSMLIALLHPTHLHVVVFCPLCLRAQALVPVDILQNTGRLFLPRWRWIQKIKRR